MHPPPHNSRKRIVRRFVSALLAAAIMATAMITAGPLPNLLDDNRGNVGLALLESSAFNAALAALAPIFLNPVSPAFSYPPVVLNGRVLANPEIHNLYLDSDWDAHNPDAPTRGQLDAMTQELVNSGYFSAAGQYGIGSASFTGSHERSVLCAVFEPIAGNAEFVDILAWVTCMAGFNPFPVPGTFPPLTGVPKGNDNSLYVVYLPRDVEIVEGGCGSFKAYHFFAAVPDLDFVFPSPIPIPVSQTVAFAVVQTKCASGATPQAIRNNIFNGATHEIIEAAHDPLVGLGWINNSVVTDAGGDNFFEELIASLSAVELDLKVGEAADICDDDGDQLDPPASQHPTQPIPIPTSDPSLGGFFLVAPYWSNQHGACAPFVPKTTLQFGTPSFGQFITSATTMTINAVDGGSGQGVASISWRVYLDGSAPPAFTTQPPPVTFHVTGADGGYTVDMFATGNNGMVEVTHSAHVILDNTAPVITIVQPTATEYTHSAVLTLDYSATDGAGSGVASLTALLDGSSTLAGHGLGDGQAINLLFELALGDHTFEVDSKDRVENGSTQSVTFSIIVTAESIKQDVQIFLAAGLIKDPGTATALLAKLNAAADARAAGKCAQAANLYRAFISLLESLSGTHVDPIAVAIMIADAEYLIAHCP
jgi:FIMAH domain